MTKKGTKIELKKLKCPIIMDALRDAGYDVSKSSPDAQIIWWDGYISPEDFSILKKNQRINKIPAMDVLCYKSTLFQSLNQMQTLFPQHFTFFPETFMLPHQYQDFQKEHFKLISRFGSDLTWIFKPKSGCCGHGIKLIQNPYVLVNDTTAAVIQRYISPYLIDGYKFDFRIYVLISTLNPLTLYIYKDGIARFCTRKYISPKKSNLDDKFSHITNTAINIENQSATNDFTRLLSSVLSDIRDNDENGADVWDRIKKTVLLTMLAIYPKILNSLPAVRKDHLSLTLPAKTPRIDPSNKYFHICGIDIILDEHLNPIVLELNDRPSMKVTFECERKLKHDLIVDAMKIVTVDGRPQVAEPDISNGWERLVPLSENNPQASMFRTIQQRAVNVFGPKHRIHSSLVQKAIIYPKPIPDKNKQLIMRPFKQMNYQ